MSLLQNTIFGSKNRDLLRDLVAYYTFENNANDSTANAYNGTLLDGSYTTGKIGNGVLFNNGLARVDIPHNTDFSFTNTTNDLPSSIAMWVNFSNFNSGANWLINKRGQLTNCEWQIAYAGGINFVKFSSGQGTVYQGIKSGSLSLNTWYLIVCTDNGSRTEAGMKIYINGALASTSSASSGTYVGTVPGTNITRIGLNAWNLTSPTLAHLGTIDGVGIWRRELGNNEILDMNNGGSGLTYPL